MYCDVSLPVPLDQPFTYSLPETLNHRIKPGCRVLVPLGSRKLTGVVLSTSQERPDGPVKEVFRLIDEEPVLDAELLALGRWISAYYCAPLGEVLRSMTPLTGEMRKSKMYSLTDAGRDAARQLLLSAVEDDPMIQVLRMLEARPVSDAYLKKKVPGTLNVLRSLQKKGFLEIEHVQADRDPLRASAQRLRATWLAAPPSALKLAKAERELHAFLELHPGSHNVQELEEQVKNASQAARALARKKLVSLELESLVKDTLPAKPLYALNPHQQEAYRAIEAALRAASFKTLLLYGVTGSGKTEVYLKAIDACLELGRSALLLVPEIALTPAVAGQFFHRFGDRVAILHSAFNDSERAEQWRRIQKGAARVVVGTRSGVFAPVQNLGLIVIDEEHDQSYKQQENPRYSGRDVAIVRAQAAGAVVVLGSATPSLETRYNAERERYG
ncbi:MAG: DEAD/DEAH box helicase family protein, partial [Acidobacteriota bacterium]|nr:DEAD/DEAH box helicase family protein [Acidobacteriota bacterium]